MEFRMNRRGILKVLVCAATVLALTDMASGQTQATKRPNIVVMLSDDMGWGQVGYQGETIIPTPNIDRLAKEGVSLTQFYVQPVCTPTRSAFLTGRYAFRTGTEIRFTANDTAGMLLDERTLAQTLKDAGYWTAIVGKWHLGSWKKEHLPMQRGFDHQYGHYGALIDYSLKMRGPVYDWHRNEKPLDEDGYSTDLIAAEAARLITEHDGEKPFFIYVPFNAVHGPHDKAPKNLVAKYDNNEGIKNPLQAANVDNMDRAVGRILDAVDARGVRDNTLVVFFNDNGGPKNAVFTNGPYRGYKNNYLEGGMRVACLLRWPGELQAGSENGDMFHCVDLYPTLVNLAGGTLDQALPLDGLDMWNALAKGTPSQRNEIAHSPKTIRMGDWKYIDEDEEYYGYKAEVSQLYNIRQDPGEARNLLDTYPGKVKEFQARMQYWTERVRPAEEHEPIPDFPPHIYGKDENRHIPPRLIQKIRENQPPQKKR
jgi:arylsulfatase A-like enzyme